jgi:putative acetyltransferase
MQIRQERAADHPVVTQMLDLAFDSEVESHLVRLIRQSAGFVPELSLVAVVDRLIVGHILLSHVTVEGTASHRVLSLAPLAVHPEHQNRGIGTALTTTAIQIARDMGESLIVLEGIPSYYPRFGFVPGAVHGIDKPSALVPDDVFMVLPLDDYDAAITGRVVYPAPFREAGAVGP